CHRIEPYDLARPLTAGEHWRLGRAFGYPPCCITTFIVMFTLVDKLGSVGERLLGTYRRFVASRDGWTYFACPICAWSHSHVVEYAACQCEAALSGDVAFL